MNKKHLKKIKKKMKCVLLIKYDLFDYSGGIIGGLNPVFGVIKTTLEKLNIEVITPHYNVDKPKLVGFITETEYPLIDVIHSIETSDFIIVDITDKDPNIMYELGFSQALRKKTLFLISKKEKYIPEELVGNLVFVYDSDRPEIVENKIKDFIKSIK